MVRWDGTVLWERETTRELDGNTTFDIDPTSYDLGSDTSSSVSYSGKRPTVSNVTWSKGPVTAPLTEGTDFSIYYENDSGTITHSGYGTKSNQAKVTLSGMNSYTGSVSLAYNISHTYEQPPKWHYLGIYLWNDTLGSYYLFFGAGNYISNPKCNYNYMYNPGSGGGEWHYADDTSSSFFQYSITDSSYICVGWGTDGSGPKDGQTGQYAGLNGYTFLRKTS